MSKMRQILPIFLLYTLTSVLFLALVSSIFYEREKFFIADRDAFAIRDFKHGLEAKLARAFVVVPQRGENFIFAKEFIAVF